MDPPTLDRALASVALQDYAPIEVVLVAACGPSHRNVDAARYPFRLTFVASDVPLPRPRAANAGLDASHGDLITFLDHDDEFLPGHLSGLAVALAARQLLLGLAVGREQPELARPLVALHVVAGDGGTGPAPVGRNGRGADALQGP